MTLAPSEFILNEDGSIYHLHLLPHQIAQTIITVGDPDRVDTVTQHFDSINVLFKSGSLKPQPVLIKVSESRLFQRELAQTILISY